MTDHCQSSDGLSLVRASSRNIASSRRDQCNCSCLGVNFLWSSILFRSSTHSGDAECGRHAACRRGPIYRRTVWRSGSTNSGRAFDQLMRKTDYKWLPFRSFPGTDLYRSTRDYRTDCKTRWRSARVLNALHTSCTLENYTIHRVCRRCFEMFANQYRARSTSQLGARTVGVNVVSVLKSKLSYGVQ